MNITRSSVAWATLLSFLVLSLEGCRVVGGIFKAGVWVGVLGVFAVVALVIWLLGRGRA
jgi:hypothetical protein